MHERVINVLLWNVAFKCTFSFFQDPFDLVEVSVGSKHPVGKSLVMDLAKYSKESVVTSTSMETTVNSEDKKGFKFKIRVKTRVLSVVI
ncbi:hypothetical protein QL285_010519 [Trifolium repens]|nr:hypothetical protein QL285_010519 [Trifolium repens]